MLCRLIQTIHASSKEQKTKTLPIIIIPSTLVMLRKVEKATRKREKERARRHLVNRRNRLTRNRVMEVVRKGAEKVVAERTSGDGVLTRSRKVIIIYSTC